MKHIVISGYVSLDRIIKVNQPLRVGYTSIINNNDNQTIYYGGCPVNIASALNHYGEKSIPLLRVGTDYIQMGCDHFFSNHQIPFEGTQIINNVATSNCYLVEDRDGNHVTIFYPGAMDDKFFKPYDEALFTNAKLAIMTVGPKLDNAYVLKQAKKHQIELVFGAKLDEEAFDKSFINDVFEQASIVFLNEFEKDFMLNTFGLADVEALFKRFNMHTVLVTYGTKGSDCYSKDNEIITRTHIDALLTDTCIDTTGSGDAYIAGFIYGYVNGYTKQQSAQMGAVLSHFAVQGKGSNTNIVDKETFLKTFFNEGVRL
jgi:adenosine kinase